MRKHDYFRYTGKQSGPRGPRRKQAKGNANKSTKERKTDQASEGQQGTTRKSNPNVTPTTPAGASGYIETCSWVYFAITFVGSLVWPLIALAGAITGDPVYRQYFSWLAYPIGLFSTVCGSLMRPKDESLVYKALLHTMLFSFACLFDLIGEIGRRTRFSCLILKRGS